jgi:hypothetical protein
VSQFGLLDACHGLLSWVYPLFIQSFRSPSAASRILEVEPMPAAIGAISGASQAEAQAAEAEAADANMPGIAGASDDERDGHAPQQPPHPEAQAHVDQQTSAPDAPKSAEDNTRFRSKGKEFIAAAPLQMLVVTRMVMEPLRQLLDAKLYIGSKRFELHQQAAATEANGEWPHREFALSYAAKNILENKFFSTLSQLSDVRLWKSITNVTERLQACAFKLISRAGCMVEYLLRYPHTLSPFDSFLLLHDPTLGPTLAAKATEAECMLHPSVLSLTRTYGENLGNLDSRMHIYMLMLMSHTDISHLESLHALIRRMLKSRLHTHGLDLIDCNSAWSLQRNRSGLPEDQTGGRKRPLSESAPEQQSAANEQRSTKRSHTNSWHLWCRQASSSLRWRLRPS